MLSNIINRVTGNLGTKEERLFKIDNEIERLTRAIYANQEDIDARRKEYQRDFSNAVENYILDEREKFESEIRIKAEVKFIDIQNDGLDDIQKRIKDSKNHRININRLTEERAKLIQEIRELQAKLGR